MLIKAEFLCERLTNMSHPGVVTEPSVGHRISPTFRRRRRPRSRHVQITYPQKHKALRLRPQSPNPDVQPNHQFFHNRTHSQEVTARASRPKKRQIRHLKGIRQIKQNSAERFASRDFCPPERLGGPSWRNLVSVHPTLAEILHPIVYIY